MNQPRYLVPNRTYMADPAAHVFNGRLYIYPSHDIESGIPEKRFGRSFRHARLPRFVAGFHRRPSDRSRSGAGLKNIPWAGRQLWDSDCAFKNGKYYLYFSLKDKNDVFHLGVAISDRPEGPFVPQDNPIKGSYSIDPCVFQDRKGPHYIIFGGLWGGQLQRYRNNKAIERGHEPEDQKPALCPKSPA